MILLVVIFILVMQFLWVYIDELVGKGLSLGIVAEFLFWGSCTVLPLALPLATLLASMMLWRLTRLKWRLNRLQRQLARSDKPA